MAGASAPAFPCPLVRGQCSGASPRLFKLPDSVGNGVFNNAADPQELIVLQATVDNEFNRICYQLRIAFLRTTATHRCQLRNCM